MIIKIINNWFENVFDPIRWFERIFIIRPKQAWDRCEIFRFRRELHYQLPPIREILYDYQLNLMSFVKIHPRHTSEIQCPVLCPRILHRLTYFVSGTMLALPFFILPQWNISRHIVCRQAPYLFFFFGKRCG